MRSKENLSKQSIVGGFWAFLALCACLSAACASSAPPPVPVSSTPPQQPNAPAAHDHGAHENENNMPRIIPEELKRLLAANQAVVIDVRSPEDYRQRHIPGAINLTMQQIESGQYPKLPRDKRLISYCT
ncbi:MAG: rhodanese-like domain-containing protein [Blastocatellales bacterium]